MTDSELIQLRDATYKPPVLPPWRCDVCRHYWASARECRMDRAAPKDVHPLGMCDAFKDVANP